jgi:hypothetical protein
VEGEEWSGWWGRRWTRCETVSGRPGGGFEETGGIVGAGGGVGHEAPMEVAETRG